MDSMKNSGVVLLGILSTWMMPVHSQSHHGNGISIIKAARHDTSEPLSSIQPEYYLLPEGHHIIPLRHLPPVKINNTDERSREIMEVSESVATPTFNLLAAFPGIGQGNYGFSVSYAPPDTNGSVGISQYVQWVNASFAVFNKSGNLIYGPVPGNTLWRGFGGLCETTNQGDPIVKYDQMANRWVMTQLAFNVDNSGNPVAPFYQCVAVSQNSDATGAYNRYAFQFTDFNDYPKLSVWPDAYYLTVNMFNANTGAFLGPQACALDRASMLANRCATAQCHQLSSTEGSLLPADLDGSTLPPAGSPEYFMDFDDNGAVKYSRFFVNWTTPSSSVFQGPTTISGITPFTPACNSGTPCIPQLGTATRLDSLGDRLMYRLSFRQFSANAMLVVNHSILGPSSQPSAIRWYQFTIPNNSTYVPTLAQQGTYAPDSNSRFMGSIATDKLGNILLGFSESSSSEYPTINFTGRAPADPSGTMQNATHLIGLGSQINLTRWGDYSSMAIDPSDDCTFWYTNQFLLSSGSFNWTTNVYKLRFANCV